MTYITGDSIYPDDWEVVSDQLVIGASRDRMSEFHFHRSAKVKQITEETEEIAMKMEKLGDGRLKLKERLNVKYLANKLSRDTSPRCCTTCDSLTFTRKHCKLCDAILCQSCAKYIEFHHAKAALLPSAPVPTRTERKLKKLRLCAKCKHLVELRKPVAHECDFTPLVSLYDEMKDLVDSSRAVMDIFLTMNESLLAGETTYTLPDLRDLRERLRKITDSIVVLSQKITALPANPGSRLARLQHYIHMAASHYVMDHLWPVQSPTQTQIEEARQKRFALLSARSRKKINTHRLLNTALVDDIKHR